MNDDSTPLPHLIDIGANLTHDSFDIDRDAVLARARSVGVAQMIVTGATLTGSTQALQLAHAHPGVLFATSGVHPHHAHELDAGALAQLADLALAPEVVAVGECGLDYFRDYSPRDAQRRAFERQLALAARTGKPVFLHQRDAHEDFVAILREHRASLAGGVAHCFTAQRPELECYLDLDLAIGMTGWICDERRGQHLLPLMKLIPPGRLMIETDSPYLLPRDLRPKPTSRRNEPMHLPHVATVIAQARGETLDALAGHTTQAARAMFGLSRAAAAPAGR